MKEKGNMYSTAGLVANMQSSKFFKNINDASFIDTSLLDDDCIKDINALRQELNNLSDEQRTLVESVLLTMDKLGVYKATTEQKINLNYIHYIKGSSKLYIQIRSQVPVNKYHRVWVGHYVGKKDDFKNSTPDDIIRKEAKKLRRKIIDKLNALL